MFKNKYLSCLSLYAVSAVAVAQNYPSKPIRFVVPNPPGGGADFVARSLAPRLTESLGQQVIVDNRPGASGVVASEFVARASPDGYTIKVNIIGDTITPSMMKLKDRKSTRLNSSHRT